nr:hypothetical protein OJOKFFHK_00042 [uncultured bacterium]
MIVRQREQSEIIIPECVLRSPQLSQDKTPGLCHRMAYGVVNCVKNLGLGVATAAAIAPIATGVSFLAQKTGFIEEMGDNHSLIKEGIANLAKLGIYLDGEAIANATCPVEEYVKQWNFAFPYNPEFHETVFSTKASLVAGVGVAYPLFEEVVFRGLIQDVLLKRIPKYIVSKVAPGKETALDSNIAKVARITLTAAAFSACHLVNFGIMPDSYVRAQLIASFVMGIGFGALKESKAGLLGAIGAHMANNVMAISPQLWSC